MARLKRTVVELLDTGRYLATVKGIETAEGKYGEQLAWEFRLDDSDATLRAWCSMTMSAGSKCGQWVRALLGDIPESLDTGDLIGLPCVLDVASLPKTNGDGEYNKVNAVLPAKRKPKPVVVVDGDGKAIPF